MTSSVIKFKSNSFSPAGETSRGKLFWERCHMDGMPYRGAQPPLFRSEEYDERTVCVCDPKNGTFYTGDPQQNAEYLKVLDGIANSWYVLQYVDRWRMPDDIHHYVYIEWLERFLEDGTPATFGPGM
jgi:hypothetical protein